MNDASQNLRRRQSVPPSIGVPLRRLQNSKKRSRSSLSSTVLTGVVACLSGLDPDLKDHLHKVITSLGGAYSREFDAQYVTHLVLDQPFGSKYEFVKNSKQSWAENIAIVTSSWVEACEREGKRASEQEFKLLDEASNDDAEFDVGKENLEGIHSIVKTENPPSIPNEIQHAPLEEACSWMLDQPIPLIFSYQSFLLVGFGEESSLRKDDDLGGANNDSSLRDNKTTNISTMEKLSRLIRRAGGTIYWEPNESISVVVLHNNCSKEVW